MLIALAILAILIGLALPSFSSTFKYYRVNGAAVQLSNALQLARAEAIRTRSVVRVGQSSANDPECSPAGSKDWHCGIDISVPPTLVRTTSLIKTIPASALAGVNVQLVAAGTTTIQYSSLGTFADAGAVGSLIYIWPSSPATDNAASSPFTSTLCLGAGGKVRVITAYATAATDPSCP